MARIPLRLYTKDIETLIEKGSIDEAIAHIKYILKIYPKHIESYRLLGKAFLESQKYTEASDILQRVLSVFPDDFISQIGMSIVREDEGNLDAAIWHMERAFEVQPANNAVQDELKRLYGRRDGVAPAKVRLTSGALIRMYARGELYPQAISEILATIKDDPKRQDLEVILARMYYLSDQKQKSIQVCYDIVSKLPYCYEANRILTELLPQFDKPEEAKAFQKRLAALDPYASLISKTITNSADINADVVMVEKLEYTPSQSIATQQPDWAKSIGVQWTETDEEKPAWLDSSTVTTTGQPKQENFDDLNQSTHLDTSEFLTAQQEDSMTDQGGKEESPQNVIPNWMASAGWGTSDKENESPEKQPDIEPKPSEEEPQADGILPAEIPDWLKSIAPSNLPIENPEKDELGSLENIFSNPVNSELEFDNKSIIDQPEEIKVTDNNLPSQENELPDWLKNLSSSNDQDDSTSDVPDWLKELDQNKSKDVAPVEDITLPDWLVEEETKTTSQEATNVVGAQDIIPEPTATIEEIPSAPIENLPVIPPLKAEMSAEDSEFAWLESLAAKQGASAETLLTNPTDRSETTPEWLSAEQDIELTPVTNFDQVPDQVSTPEATPIEDSNLPDWLAEAIAEETPAVKADNLVEPKQESIPPVSSQTLEWQLEEQLSQAEPAIEPENSIQEISAQKEDDNIDIPDWLRTEIEDTRGLTDAQLETFPPIEPVPASQATSEPQSSAGDIDSALAWLETLAEKQGADKQTLFVPPDQRLSEPPEWIQEATQNAADEQTKEQTTIISDEIISSPVKSETTAGSLPPLPDWLQVLQDSSTAKESVDFSTGAEQGFEYLQEQPVVSEPIESEILQTPDESISTDIKSDATVENVSNITPPLDTAIPSYVEEAEIPSQGEQQAQINTAPGLETLNIESEPAIETEIQVPQIVEEQLEAPVAEIVQEIPVEESAEDILDQARQAFQGNDLSTSIELYNQMIQTNDRLPEVIKDIKDALYAHPVDIDLWQTFGDALANDNQINEALEAYTKAESLLR